MQKNKPNTTGIISAEPRSNIQVRFPDGRAFDGPAGSTIEAFIHTAFPEEPWKYMAAEVNGRLRELTRELHADADLIPITANDSNGARIYRRSLSFLLVAAAKELFPDDVIEIQHSMVFGGYYCERRCGVPFSAESLAKLEKRMQTLVENKLPISHVKMPLAEALQIFRDNGDEEKADLFARRRNNYLTLYQLNSARDYFHGFMVPNTSYLPVFALLGYGDGFILQFPRRRDPHLLQPFDDTPALVNIFQSYKDWLNVIGVPSVTSLNQAIATGRIQEVILVAEALHQRQLSQIGREISERDNKVKLILISGPTSAGKTTFSKRLAVQLLARGIHPVAVGMDDYFVNRLMTPLDETGDYDYEHIDSVDVPLFINNLGLMLRGETINRPIYNFISGTREWSGQMRLREDQVLIVEGIHALNPRLTEGLPEEAIFRVYINPFTQLNLDKHNRVATTDTRKLRRMVRDFHHRGYSAADTIARWPKVRAGEKKWIFPHQLRADIYFNSALVFELSALKPLAEPILLMVEPDTPERIEANRLRAFLQWFDPIPEVFRSSIPNESILREFIGGSILESFEPWIE